MESRATRAWDGVAICDPQVERNVRNDMPTGWSGVSLSDVPGRDSRAFKSSAYMVICVDNSMGRIYGNYRAYRKINANGGRRCWRLGLGTENQLREPARRGQASGVPSIWGRRGSALCTAKR